MDIIFNQKLKLWTLLGDKHKIYGLFWVPVSYTDIKSLEFFGYQSGSRFTYDVNPSKTLKKQKFCTKHNIQHGRR